MVVSFVVHGRNSALIARRSSMARQASATSNLHFLQIAPFAEFSILDHAAMCLDMVEFATAPYATILLETQPPICYMKV
jgi:hypothetical protein